MNMFSATLSDRGDVELLRHKHDARRLRLAHAAKPARRPVDREFSLVGARGINAGHDLHQGRFAGAVFADDPDRLPRPDVEVDVGRPPERRGRTC